MEEEASAAQPQPGASPRSPPSGATVGRVLLPVGLLFSLLPGAGEAVTCWYGLWWLPAAEFQGWGQMLLSQPTGWLKWSETHRQ